VIESRNLTRQKRQDVKLKGSEDRRLKRVRGKQEIRRKRELR
jgi:hypothetical protein